MLKVKTAGYEEEHTVALNKPLSPKLLGIDQRTELIEIDCAVLAVAEFGSIRVLEEIQKRSIRVL